MKTKIIILIPHFNALSDLKKSLISIQEPFDIDLMIVDDGSMEKPSLDELKQIYMKGVIYLECLPKNIGIEKALNFGLKKIHEMNYEYTGRLDQGDLCYPDKFSKQLNYLEQNKDVFLLGTWVEMVDENMNFLFNLKHPTSYNEIKKKMYINSMFVHPTIVFRTEIVNTVGYYPENYQSAEDFAYIFTIMKSFKVENYPEILLKYVVSSKSISSRKRKQQVKNRIKITLKHFKFGFYPIYGLARNSLLYFMSRESTNFLKKHFIPK